MHAKPSRPRKRARPSTRRKTVRWSTREVDALLAGVRTYGVGKWARILRHSPVFNGVRTSVDLKDKWRNLTSPVRAAALAGEKAPAADPPTTPSLEQSQPLGTSSPVSTPHLVESPAHDVQSPPEPKSPPQSTQSPTPTASFSELASATPDLLATPPFAPPTYNQITPYPVTPSLYHSAATLAADYWRRVSHEAMYGITPYSSIFPYVKQSQLPHSDDDDDDDDDDDEAVLQPLYNPYNLAVAHMFNRVDIQSLGHTLTPRPGGAAPISTEPSATETDSYPEEERLLPACNSANQPQNADAKVSSSALTLDIAFTSETQQVPTEDADETTVEPAPYEVEERKTSTSGDSDQSMLPNNPLFVPDQSLTATMGSIQ